MGTMLGLAHRGGAFLQVTQTALGGSGTNDLYGALEREPQQAVVDGGWERIGSMVSQLGDDIYALASRGGVTPRVYKGFDGAILVRTDGVDPTPTLPLKGETMTQGSVTGVLAEDYKAGDDFFVVTGEIGGSFGAGTVTFTTGDDAVLVSRESNGGQFGIEAEASIAGKTATLMVSSGLHHGVKSGKPTLGYIYVDNSQNIHSVVRNPSNGLWEENDTLLQYPDSTMSRNCGSVIHRNTIYWLTTGGGTADDVFFMTFNIGTGIATVGSILSFGAGSYLSHPVIWNGRIFFAGAKSGNDMSIYEITGGAAIQVLSLPQGLGSWDITSAPTGFVGTDDNALYWVARQTISHNQVIRLYDDGNDIVLSCPAAVTNSLAGDVGEALLPATIRTSISDSSHGNAFLDLELTPGTKIQRFWHYNGVLVGATEFEYVEAIELDGGLVATVSGTIGSANDLIFQNSVAGVLSVGDWVILGTQNSCFRVAAVSTVNVRLASLTTVSSPTGIAIRQPTPTAGSEVISKVQIMSIESGLEGGLAGVALPHGDMGGGHIYTIGEISGEIDGQLGVSEGVQIEFSIYDPFSNSAGGDLEARGYFMKEDGTFGQMTLVSVGQGNETTPNTNDSLSPGSGNTFVWDSTGDGVTNGLFTDKFVEIELP